MARSSSVYDNWERLVEAALRRDHRRHLGYGNERSSSSNGIAGAVPDSLKRETNINAILQAADEIQAQNPTVARILCEQAYTMAQDLDPRSDGKGVLQFKTGLMSLIKQKQSKRGAQQIDRGQDVEQLWEFYQEYKRRNRVDDIQKEDQKRRESKHFSTSQNDSRFRDSEMRKVLATVRALVVVMEALSKYVSSDGVGRSIMDELRRVKKSDAILSAELMPYNIVPIDAPSPTNAVGFFPEVKAATSAIRYPDNFPRLPASFEIPPLRDADIFDFLEYVFGFQLRNH